MTDIAISADVMLEHNEFSGTPIYCKVCKSPSTHIRQPAPELPMPKTPEEPLQPLPQSGFPLVASAVSAAQDAASVQGGADVWCGCCGDDRDNVDPASLLHIGQKVFQFPGTEKLCACIEYSGFIRFGSDAPPEEAVSLVLSNMFLYILEKGEGDGYVDRKVKEHHRFSDVQAITVGPFFQYFRLEIAADLAYVFLARSHRQTHKFLDLLLNNIHMVDSGTRLPLKITNRNSETISNFYSACPSGTKNSFIALFLPVFVRVKAATKNPDGASTAVLHPAIGQVTAVTLVATRDRLYMCRQNFREWPTTLVVMRSQDKFVVPTAPQFRVLMHQALTDLDSVVLFQDQSNVVGINFSSEGQRRDTWQVVAFGADEAAKLCSTLKKLYFKVFRTALKVVQAPHLV
eukprot:TRINITY_DN2166_c0_g1_i13.p2 TRINITY_DN2166_c0_g1~~TRINITY_DN2166_c0_g1_i13.p2  ORF type:complete len:402 (-),score=91.37 TRINITY_DN2166_c0_g1_i13:1741-2946(-)